MQNADKVILRVSLFTYENITDDTFRFHRNARLHIAKLNPEPGISDEEMITNPGFKLPRSELQRINDLRLLKKIVWKCQYCEDANQNGLSMYCYYCKCFRNDAPSDALDTWTP